MSDEGFDEGLGELVSTCETLRSKFAVCGSMVKAQLSDEKPQLYLPLGSGADPTAGHKYVFLACGGGSLDHHFCSLLKDSLTAVGVAIKIGLKYQHYPELRQAIIGCQIFVLVIDENDDQRFLNRMLLEANDVKKPVLMCPVNVAKVSEGGMGYSAASAANMRTACFTDWVGNGFSAASPLYQNLFQNFQQQLAVLDPDTALDAQARSEMRKFVAHDYANLILNPVTKTAAVSDAPDQAWPGLPTQPGAGVRRGGSQRSTGGSSLRIVRIPQPSFNRRGKQQSSFNQRRRGSLKGRKRGRGRQIRVAPASGADNAPVDASRACCVQ